MKPLLNSSGIDEKVASDFIVDSPIDSFRENISKLTAGADIKDRLKEARRQGKNRNAAKKSRQNQMARMSRLRERHKSLTKELADIQFMAKKVQVSWKIEICKIFSKKFHCLCNSAIYFQLFNFIGAA